MTIQRSASISSPRTPSRGSRGFTLIELLTVIALIVILAGILFPTLSIMRAKMRQGQCMANMHSLQQALKMYRDDWRVYPEALYGVARVARYEDGVPVYTGFEKRLGVGDYVRDEKVFTCPNSPAKPTDENRSTLVSPINPMTGQPTEEQYSAIDSYTFQYRPNKDMSQPTELHYNPWWTKWLRPLRDPFSRELRYRRPSDETVVTWCLYHSDMNSAGNPSRGGVAVVAYLSGRVQLIDASRLAVWPAECTSGSNFDACPWAVPPKP
jgi:prepilin-type N-terminal cleavage/methylation domain-containing protein